MVEQILKKAVEAIDSSIAGSSVTTNIREPKDQWSPKYWEYRNNHLSITVFQDNDSIKVQFSRFVQPAKEDVRNWDARLAPLPTEFETGIIEIVFLEKVAFIGCKDEQNSKGDKIVAQHPEFLSFCKKLGMNYVLGEYNAELEISHQKAHEQVNILVEELKDGKILAP